MNDHFCLNLANTDLELEGLAPVVAGIELLSVRQRAPIMHGERVTLRQKHRFTVSLINTGKLEPAESAPSSGSPCHCRAWLS